MPDTVPDAAPGAAPGAAQPALQDLDPCTQEALCHIRYLSQQIGGRGSCTRQEREASDYVINQMNGLGLQAVKSEPFQAVPSTYWPYGLSFATACLGSALIVGLGGQDVLILAAILNLLGVWGMLAETEFAPSWTRWFLPRAASQNASGRLAPSGPVERRVVLCAHVDTHRTPLFYSSNAWYALFTLLVALGFLSMLGGSILYGLAAWQGWGWVRLAAALILLAQAFAATLCIQADLTPYTPGANDNASGVGAALALAQRLRAEPLTRTEIHLAITGCEEVGDWGIAAYLDAHAADLGPDTLYIILDEIGLGSAKYLTRDGLLRKRATHPRALGLARRVKASNPGLRLLEGPGLAYTDALAVTRRGLMALTLCAVPEPGAAAKSHWHQMSDTLENLDPADLANSIQAAWALLQAFDSPAEGGEL